MVNIFLLSLKAYDLKKKKKKVECLANVYPIVKDQPFTFEINGLISCQYIQIIGLLFLVFLVIHKNVFLYLYKGAMMLLHNKI